MYVIFIQVVKVLFTTFLFSQELYYLILNLNYFLNFQVQIIYHYYNKE